MAIIPRSLFIKAAKKEEEQRLLNEHKLKPETTITALAYYSVKTLKIDADFTSATVVERSGSSIKFDELLKLNSTWTIKKIWPRYRVTGFRYYTMSALNGQTGHSTLIEFKLDVKGKYVTGIINYSAEKYFFLMKDDGFDIYVYEGREIEMLAFWGCSAYTKPKKKKAIADQIEYLIATASSIA